MYKLLQVLKTIRSLLTDADLDTAVTEIISAAFGSAGERCMAASVVAVEETWQMRLLIDC